MLTVLIRYKGKEENVKHFVKEMVSLEIVDQIRNEEGNIRYEYFFPLEDPNSVLLVDSWINQEALDKHHQLPLMKEIVKLREKYDLHMEVEKYGEFLGEGEDEYVRK